MVHKYILYHQVYVQINRNGERDTEKVKGKKITNVILTHLRWDYKSFYTHRKSYNKLLIVWSPRP